MVEIPEEDLSKAADMIDALFEGAFGSRQLSATEMRESLEAADTLREAVEDSKDYKVPGVGSEMYDPINESKVQVTAHREKTAGELTVNGLTICKYNRRKHALDIDEDEPLVEVEYGNGNWTSYTMPVSRLEEYHTTSPVSCKYMED